VQRTVVVCEIWREPVEAEVSLGARGRVDQRVEVHDGAAPRHVCIPGARVVRRVGGAER
jgi:hypothetical protein